MSNEIIKFYKNIENKFYSITNLKNQILFSQYFTSIEIASYMIRFSKKIKLKKKINILDPGAGLGIFAAVICDLVIKQNSQTEIFYECYEIDKDVIKYLDLNLTFFAEKMKENGNKFSFKINNCDFISSNTKFVIKNSKYINNYGAFDIVISNPPYGKIKEGKSFNEITKEKMIHRSNYYPLFMLIGSQLLKNKGEFIMITPRSYCSGYYFKEFRQTFLKFIYPIAFHRFESRIKIFEKHGILQEVVIIYGLKGTDPVNNVLLYSSVGIPNGDNIKKTSLTLKDLITNDDNKNIRLPSINKDKNLLYLIDNLENKFDTLELNIGNGPVVPFRVEKFLKNHKLTSTVPLIWMHNINLDKTIKNTTKNGFTKIKPPWITNNSQTSSILKDNKDYIMIKRFVNKESNQILESAFYPKSNKYDKVGIENHVNFVCSSNGKNLKKSFVTGLIGILNSLLYNRYFSISNGTTQVNVSWLKHLKFPAKMIISELGRYIIDNKLKTGDPRIDSYFCELIYVDVNEFLEF
ncbi:MAG: tRNA1(Val) (adenine(37)-N6)-methyltransferase [Candidatus Heimdallarchaeota archaeon LC_2]|nr:MAG: tRNA1(Val) (adenine(37)-N6)-methyltransferase [Candidatus Heimdallarchaeota archaeon LC_2]